MPYIGNSRGKYVSAHAQIVHGQVAADGGFVGVAVKQVTPPADLPRTERATIFEGEGYFLETEGTCEVPAIGGATQGELIYVNTTTNALGTASGGSEQVLGRVAELAGVHGTPTGMMRVDMDLKV